MAHMIEMKADGTASMAYAGDVPWHGLGRRVPNDLTPDQMAQAAGLDWEVRKVKAYAHIAGKRRPIGWSALVRNTDDKVLDIVSDAWNPVQNSEAFQFFADFVASGGMEMHTAGSLQGGCIVWALAKVNESFELFGGDRVDSYMLFTNPHRFGQAIDVRFTPIRVVCNNTLTLSLDSASRNFQKVTHRKKFDADEVKQAMGIAHVKLTKYREMAEFLGSKRATADRIVEYFKTVFPGSDKDAVSRNAKRAIELVETQPGARFAAGSWWQPFNAVTRMADHELGRTVDNRLESAWYGNWSRKKVEALNTALEFAEAA